MLVAIIILLAIDIVINSLIYHTLNNLPKQPRQKRVSKKNIDIIPMDIDVNE